MEEIVKIVNGFDDEKKKKLFSELCDAKTIEKVIDIGNNYNLNVSKEVAKKVYDGIQGAEKLSDEELIKVVGGGGNTNVWGAIYGDSGCQLPENIG